MDNVAKPIVGTLLSITRYVIKGFPGEYLANIHLNENRGLPHDRRWAIRNGSIPDNQKREWEPCAAFVRMTQHEELPIYHVENKNKQYYLVHPAGEKIAVKANINCAEKLSKWFKHDDMALSYSTNKTAYWDHRDAHISIINLSTVKAMSAAAGVELDPQRFRGNLLIETGEPWSEFSLIGQRIVIGESELEILRPIDRCKATSVNPKTGMSDINIPHFLSSRYGHFFCGVYARVVKSGGIAKDDKMYHQYAAPQALKDATKVDTAPAPEHWPRTMRVVQKANESHNVISFYLADPLCDIISNIAPASYLRLHIQSTKGPLSRSYTVSKQNKAEGYLRLSIKKEDGDAQCSPWLHNHLNEGDMVLASGPFVDPSLQWRPHLQPTKDVLILTAGIGITVATSILSALQKANHQSIIRVAHSVHYAKDAALWNEVTNTVNALHNAKAWIFITRETITQQDCYTRSGRITINDITKDIDPHNVQVFLCGPKGFGSNMRQTLLNKGVDGDAIHEDVFYSPMLAESTTKTPSSTHPIAVTFVDNAMNISKTTWQPTSGTLLDLAESNGIAISANCRSGACRVCLQPIISGEIEYLTEPATPAPRNWAYLCCASPLTAVTIKLRDSTI
ncbi:2Fe-2S iron-sulfur cluster-binding protein [Paraglaciecola sp.]|uniref:MOSC domain-containing protein n=1 Tax=Paraglaciecola sp. TaxID=1920173 RepID=UPI0030F393C4